MSKRQSRLDRIEARLDRQAARIDDLYRLLELRGIRPPTAETGTRDAFFTSSSRSRTRRWPGGCRCGPCGVVRHGCASATPPASRAADSVAVQDARAAARLAAITSRYQKKLSFGTRSSVG